MPFTPLLGSLPPIFLFGTTLALVKYHKSEYASTKSEEHGVLISKAETNLRIGDRVIIIPVHCCTTVVLHEQVLMVSAEGTATWDEVGARGWQPAPPRN